MNISKSKISVKDSSSISVNPAMKTAIKKPGKAYNDFINSHYTNGQQPITNVRIKDKKNNISGGSYHIDESEYKDFLDMYAKEIIVKNIPEYLTELQLESNGPILVDIDLHYDYSVLVKQYELFHVEEIVDHYLDILKSFYQFNDATKFNVYVQEKDRVNRVEEKNMTKDGIHIVIGISADRQTQADLRKRIIALASESCSELPIINPWDEVFDDCITTGKTGWQLYGSRKPLHDVYKLTHIYEITYDEEDDECKRTAIQLNDFDVVSNIYQLSARCTTHPKFMFKSEYLNSRPTQTSSSKEPSIQRSQSRRLQSTDSTLNAYILQIKTQEDLDNVHAEFIDTLLPQEYDLREANDYTMILPETYYEVGSFSKWIRIGWALRNISDKLLIVWIKFSAQASTWSFGVDVADLYERWQNFDLKNPNGLTKHSIMHWAKQDAPELYKKVRANTIDYYIDQTVKSITVDNINNDKNSRGCTDFDIANILHQMYKSDFVCVSVKNNIWYRLKNHLWIENDSGTTLRKAISTQLRDLYWSRAQAFMEQAANLNPPDEERSKRMQDVADKILKICERLGRANEKKNIMTEAKELFFDSNFLEKLDTNPYLLSFKNGVIDFKQKCFRKGYPEDYLSKCTNIDYIPIDEEHDGDIVEEIRDFMHKLFPIKEIHDYMWDHLASVLIGTSSVNQTFNMYIGEGKNGKSVLMELMTLCLGEYKGDVPLTLVTRDRAKVGGLAPELLALKGVRLAVMNEPSKNDQLNEGVMKQLTSGLDPIQARAPYMLQSVTFIPQFKLVVCSNEFMVIKSQDHGTWRRIRVVDFVSYFDENPVQGDPEKPYQYVADPFLKEKFDRWKFVFNSMLVDIAFRTNGVVKDCARVMASSNSYKNSFDYIGDFIRDKIVMDTTGKILKSEITTEFTMWYEQTYGRDSRGRPSTKEVHAYFDKRFGKYEKHKLWLGIRINYDKSSIENSDEEDNADNISSNEL
jgi:P4 family phage/plasmid primase-like protien